MVAPFKEKLRQLDPSLIRFQSLHTLQMNIGNICNQQCSHCHVDASPLGRSVMPQEVMEKAISFLTSRRGTVTLDITGGCPELNPHFRFLLDKTVALSPRRLVRTNLTIVLEPSMSRLPDLYAYHRLVVFASLPCYSRDNVDRQRGEGTFTRSIEALKMLNRVGYGTELELNLVYNPGGGFLPGSQHSLEAAYRKELGENFGVVFSNLYTITNAPIGRFKDHLAAAGTLDNYVQMLENGFNPDTADKLMCRTLISIDWRGYLYNCDFNQAMGLPITGEDGRALTLDDIEEAITGNGELVLAQHCYSCTAGEGSSCTGALSH